MLVGNSQTLLVLHRSGAGCAIASLNKKSRQLQVEMKLAVLFKRFLLIDQLQTHNFEVDKIKTFCIFMVVSFCSASELSAKTTNIDFQFTRGNRTSSFNETPDEVIPSLMTSINLSTLQRSSRIFSLSTPGVPDSFEDCRQHHRLNIAFFHCAAHLEFHGSQYTHRTIFYTAAQHRAFPIGDI